MENFVTESTFEYDKMNELVPFLELKNKILIEYQKNYPYFQGNWKSFSSNDIRQLIDLIETQLKERVSEKWVYTHLKPETNEKLPRKDMLDIFSKFVGYSDWNDLYLNTKIKKPISEIVLINIINGLAFW